MRPRRAFTLVELVITVTVMSVIAGVGFVALNAVSDRQQRAQAVGDMQTVVELERRYAALNDDYTPDPSELSPLPDDLVVTAGPVTEPGTVSIAVGVAGSLATATLAPDGTCRGLRVPSLTGAAAKAKEQVLDLPDHTLCESQSFLPPGEWPLEPGAPSDATVLLKADDFAGSQTWSNSGSTQTAGDATLGESQAVEQTDPVWLPYSGQPYVYLPSQAGNSLTTDDRPSQRLTTAADIQIEVALDNWGSTSDVPLVTKWNSDPATLQRAYWFGIVGQGPARRLTLLLSPNGSTAVSATATEPLASYPAAQHKWLRASWSGVSGSVTFFTSSDGSNWATVGEPVAVNVASLHPSTAPIAVGTQQGSTTASLGGKVYRVRVGSTAESAAALLGTSMCSQNVCEASTGELWDVHRSTTGLRATVVDRPLLLVGGGSFVQVPDNAAVDMPADAERTVVVVGRFHGAPPVADAQIVSKRASATSGVCATGWSISFAPQATPFAAAVVAAGSCQFAPPAVEVAEYTPTAVGVIRSEQSVTAFAGVDRVSLADSLSQVPNTPAVDATNALPVRIGQVAAAGDAAGSFELFGFAVYPRALSVVELDAVVDELSS